MTDEELIEKVAHVLCETGAATSWKHATQSARHLLPIIKAERVRGGEMVKEAAADWFADRFSDAVQADCESGVKWLNERAAKAYLKDAPDTLAAIREGEEAIRGLSIPAVVEAGDETR